MVERRDYRARVGAWIMARRAALAITQEQLAVAAGVSVRTIGSAERGERALRTSLHAGVERALGWELGSLAHAYRHGGEPRLAMLPTTGDDPVTLEIIESPDLSARDKRELLRLRDSQLSALRAEIERRKARRTA